MVAEEPVPSRQQHTVMPNDNFWTIARDYPGVSAKDIAAANPGVDSRKLKVGQVLQLPAGVKSTTPKVPTSSPTVAATSEVKYKVKSGDTLTGISREYGVTVKELQAANGLKGSLIRVGQELVIPVPKSSGTGR